VKGSCFHFFFAVSIDLICGPYKQSCYRFWQQARLAKHLIKNAGPKFNNNLLSLSSFAFFKHWQNNIFFFFYWKQDGRKQFFCVPVLVTPFWECKEGKTGQGFLFLVLAKEGKDTESDSICLRLVISLDMKQEEEERSQGFLSSFFLTANGREISSFWHRWVGRGAVSGLFEILPFESQWVEEKLSQSCLSSFFNGSKWKKGWVPSDSDRMLEARGWRIVSRQFEFFLFEKWKEVLVPSEAMGRKINALRAAWVPSSWQQVRGWKTVSIVSRQFEFFLSGSLNSFWQDGEEEKRSQGC